MSYAIIRVGGKQHRVREGEYLLVDRLPYEEGATFTPEVLLVGGEKTLVGADAADQQVTARVTDHVLGPKVVIGKHRRRTGYRRRNGFRAHLSRIEIEAIGAKRPARRSRAKAEQATAAAGEE